MKRLIYLLILSISLILTSCKKDNELNIYGTWVLVDGTLYVDNMETGEKTKYHHFADGKTRSQLSGFNKPTIGFEVLIKDSTTWEFKRNGDFILNGNVDSPMFCNIRGYYMSIIEHPTSGISMLGGSARPFEAYTYDYKKKIMIIKIQEQVGSKDGRNIEWRSELLFRQISTE
jgi:hypothetical protein